ncbi:MAG: hypothetical protein AXW15_11885 [Neptuniibacter sp. Phe_28]|nr:MAG: hypothetical protein AXW15_11885 [Neptuniibacter sp. Phe_28]
MLLIHPSKLLCTLLFFLSFSIHAAVTAKLDQSTIYQGEKLTLTLETDQTNQNRPDLRALQKDYVILSTKKVTLSSHSTNAVITRNRWVLSLRPIGDGEKVIPSIKVGTEVSPEVSLSVLPAEQNPHPSEGALRPIYLEVELNKEEVYIGGQAILSARIFHLTTLSQDTNLSQPESIDALIKPLEEQKKYTTVVRGQRYTVTENNYAVFPRQEGMIEISPLFLSTTLANDTVLELNSPPQLLSVLPPTYNNSNTLWLPAKSLHIEDNLSDIHHASAGTAFTRIISMEAEGLPASVLPSLSVLENELAEIKLLNVILEEQMTERGVISQRTEELVITPSEAGEITLPPIDIPWWNTLNDQGQTASLPSRILLTSAPSASDRASPVNNNAHSTPHPSNQTPELLIWLLTAISIISALGWIYSFNQLRILKNDSKQNETEIAQEQTMRKQAANEIAEKNTFQALSMACNQNNPTIAQLRLIEWAQSFWNDPLLLSLEHICERANNQTFTFLILDLEQYLYSQSAELWQGDLLLDTIEKLRQRQQRLIAMEEDDNPTYG